MLPKVFRVLCALDPKGYQYQKPLLEQMLLLKFHEYTNSPTWYLLKNHFHLFNEEVGEVSLSVLCRLQKPVLSKRPDVEHWDKSYKLSKVFQDVDDSVMSARGKNDTRSRPIKMKNHEETIRKTQVFLEGLISTAGRGNFTMLSGPKKEWNSKRFRAGEWQKETSVGRTKTVPMFKKDISNILLNRWRLVQKETGSNWAAKNMGSSWPEYDRGLAGVLEDEEDEEAEGDEGDEIEGDEDEGDDEGGFLLQGEDASSAGNISEDDNERLIREQEEYMAPFVQSVEENAGEEGLEEASPGDDQRVDDDDSSGAARKRTRQRIR